MTEKANMISGRAVSRIVRFTSAVLLLTTITHVHDIHAAANTVLIKDYDTKTYYGESCTVSMKLKVGEEPYNYNYYTGDYVDSQSVKVTIKRDGKLIDTKEVEYNYSDWESQWASFEYIPKKAGLYKISTKISEKEESISFKVKKASAIKKYKPVFDITPYSDYFEITGPFNICSMVKIYKANGTKGKYKLIETFDNKRIEPYGSTRFDKKNGKTYRLKIVMIAKNGKKKYKKTKAYKLVVKNGMSAITEIKAK